MAPEQQSWFLAICSYSPGQQLMAREALDAILATAVFNQSVRVFFCGDGVWQLLPGQGDYSGSEKPLSQSLGALPLYDVEAVYADASSLEERGLSHADLLPMVEVIDTAKARALLRGCAGIMSF